MARLKWVLGNWKQNLLREPAATVARGIASGLQDALGGAADVRVGVAPTFVALDAVRPHTGAGTDQLRLLAQDCAAQESGAFTGEVGPAMLQDAGVHATIIGHSERRAYYGDTDEVVAAKVRSARAADLATVLCVGEQLDQRDAGNHESVVISQLSAALSALPPEQIDEHFAIAYEPVWAIGTGRTATPEQANDMHAAIRAWMGKTFPNGADRSVLYGGSVKPANAAQLIAASDVDGFLVGGASLDADSFLAIVRAAAG